MTQESAALKIELNSRICAYREALEISEIDLLNASSESLKKHYEQEVFKYETKISEVEDLLETAKRYIFK